MLLPARLSDSGQQLLGSLWIAQDASFGRLRSRPHSRGSALRARTARQPWSSELPTLKGKWKDADIGGTGLFTTVWVRRSNRWQAQTIQQTHAAENCDETAIKPK
jgi:hypothetical protein